MKNIDLSSYNKDELIDALRILKKYCNSLKQIGARSILIDSKNPEKKFFIIEHTSNIDKNFLEDFANSACKKFFPNSKNDIEKKFVINEKIIWGIRIFYGDDMLDLSFQDVVTKLS